MENIKRLMELRKKRKAAKPKFVERESHLYPRIKARWRYPKGNSSAIRRGKRGEPVLVNPGYGSPREVRGLHSSGLEKIVVHNARELQLLNPQKQGAVLSSTLGNRKRMELLQLAVDKKIKVLNWREPGKIIENFKNSMAERKNFKTKKLAEKSRKEEEKKKKAEEKLKKEAEEKKAKEEKNSGASDVKSQESKDEAIKAEKSEEQQEQKEAVEKTLIKRQ